MMDEASKMTDKTTTALRWGTILIKRGLKGETEEPTEERKVSEESEDEIKATSFEAEIDRFLNDQKQEQQV
jgi:hypothetical protein